MFSKEQFTINLDTGTVCCPNGIAVSIRQRSNANSEAVFDKHCAACPLRSEFTTAKGRETDRHRSPRSRTPPARSRQQDPVWRADYRATRPEVERKLAHLMRRRHGGRRARVRGTTKVDADFNILAAATDLARLAALGLRSTTMGWAIAR